MTNNVDYIKFILPNKDLEGKLLSFLGKINQYWQSIIPSLNVSGYGATQEDSINDLEYNLKVLCEDLFSLNETQRDLELNKMGWEKDVLLKNHYFFTYQENSIDLQIFDFPNEVKITILEP